MTELPRKRLPPLADVLAAEIEELPKHLPFYTLPAEVLIIKKRIFSFSEGDWGAPKRKSLKRGCKRAFEEIVFLFLSNHSI